MSVTPATPGMDVGPLGHNGEVLRDFVDQLARPRARWGWWLAARVLVVLVTLGMMFHYDWKHVFDDLDVYSRWGEGLAVGHVPAEDPMWQYPPLAAFVFGGVGLLGGAPWLFAVLFVLVDVAISVILARDAKRRGRWHGFAVWIVAPLLIGPLLYGRYDSIPTAFALAGLLAVSAPVAGAVLAIGGGLKVWPAVVAMSLRQRDWLRGAAGAAAASVLILLASVLTFPSVIEGFLGNGEARGLQTESVAALPFVWARFFNAEAIPEAFRYGSSEVGVPLADAIAPWLLPLTAIGLVVLMLARLTGRLDHAPIADIAFATVLWLMVTSRVLSPQYNVWIVGLAALVWAAGSPRMRLATIPVVVTALAAQALYPFAYIDIIDGGFVGIVLQTVRIVALLAAMWLAIQALLPARDGTTDGTPPELAEAELATGTR